MKKIKQEVIDLIKHEPFLMAELQTLTGLSHSAILYWLRVNHSNLLRLDVMECVLNFFRKKGLSEYRAVEDLVVLS